MPTPTVQKRKKKTGPPVGTTSISNGNGGNFTESAMDEFLAKQGLYRKPIAKDGSCLFRAVSEQVHNCQARHLDVRNQCIEFMRKNRMQFEEFVEGPFDHHLYKLKNPKEWAGQVEITALSKMFRKDFVVYQDINAPPTKVTDHGYKDKILLCYSNGNHYDIIYNNHYQEHAAMCQSLLFEMLYNKVFATLDKKESPKKGKPRVSNSQDNRKNIMDLVNGNMIEDNAGDDEGWTGDDDGWTEVKSKARVKHERHSKCNEVEEEKEPEEIKNKGSNDQKNLWELKRSVDPHLYRNIPLEVWEEDKHVLQQKDMAVAVSLQFKKDERCSVKLGPPIVGNEKVFNAIIKEDYTGSGSILVYVPDLGKRHTVPIQTVSSQQSPGYKELSGHYQKDFNANGPATEEGGKDDSKFKKKRPPRNRRGPGKGGDEAGSVNEDVQPRGRGKPRERNRHRFAGRKDDRNMKDMKEEEARFMEEQIKLVELQEKDTTAFPALPSSGQTTSSVVSPDKKTEITISPIKETKVPDTEKSPSPVKESTPANFWSNFNKKSPKQPTEETKSAQSVPVAKQQEPEHTDMINPNLETEVQQGEENQIIPESFNKKEIIQDKEIEENEHLIFPPEETSHFKKPLQIKPIMDDSHHGRTGPVFEVKIPDQDLIKPVKLTPENLIAHTEEERTKYSKHIEEERIEEPIEDGQAEENRDEDVEEQEEEILPESHSNVELAVQEAATALEGSEMQQPNNFSPEKPFLQEQPDFSQDEQSLKGSKQRDNALTPERKTVTFAEETKEIPDVPYGQSQKGILFVNGNRAEQGYKAVPTDDYSSLSKDNSKQDYMMVQENPDKDHQMFPSGIANDGMQSSSPITQQQLNPYGFFLPPNLPQNVQLPARPSMDPNGSDLPQDIPTLRYFFNLGYQYYCQMVTANQMANQQLPLMYMYQPGPLQDQMMQQAAQPVVSVPQQQLYGGLQHQHAAFQAHGMQNYFHHMTPPTSQENVSQLDRSADRSAQQQQQVQPQSQIQMPHQQQSGHFQQQQGQMQWRNNPGGSSRHMKFQHHNMGAQSHRPTNWQQGTGNQRQQHNSNKQNRKTQSGKARNDHYSQHFSNPPHAQSMSHNAAVNSSYYSVPGEHQTKAHSAGEMYHMYSPYTTVQPVMPHPTGPRGNNY